MFSAISSRSMIGGVPVKHVEMKSGWGNILWARVDRMNRIRIRIIIPEPELAEVIQIIMDFIF